MVDPINAAIGATAASAVSAGAAIYNSARVSSLKKDIKRQRTEMYILEGASLLALIATGIEHIVWKKQYNSRLLHIEMKIENFESVVSDIREKVNNGDDIKSIKSSLQDQSVRINNLTEIVNKIKKENKEDE